MSIKNKEKKQTLLISLLIIWLFCSYPLVADTFISNDKTYYDVYILEGIHNYYILFPETGAIESVLKQDIISNTLIFDEPEKRIALKKKWDEKQPVSVQPPEKIHKVLNVTDEGYPAKSTIEPSGFVLKRKGNASQNNVLKKLYSNRENNTSHVLPGSDYYSNNTYRKVDGKSYGFYNARGVDSLPKVVLRNPPVSGGDFMYRNYGRNPFMGFGRMVRMPAGYGYGMAMFNDVTVISNISDLFSTIDDRLVGEFGPTKLIPSTVNSRNNR